MELQKSLYNDSCYDAVSENEWMKYPILIVHALALIHKNYALKISSAKACRSFMLKLFCAGAWLR